MQFLFNFLPPKLSVYNWSCAQSIIYIQNKLNKCLSQNNFHQFTYPLLGLCLPQVEYHCSIQTLSSQCTFKWVFKELKITEFDSGTVNSFWAFPGMLLQTVAIYSYSSYIKFEFIQAGIPEITEISNRLNTPYIISDLDSTRQNEWMFNNYLLVTVHLPVKRTY
jgi:hypothetical protein